MTVSYDITTNVGRVRLNIGDTDTTNYVFTDEEIGVFLTSNDSNIGLASADTLEAWAAKYATNADSERIGDYSYAQKVQSKLLTQAKSFRDKADSKPITTWSEMDLTDGSGITAESD